MCRRRRLIPDRPAPPDTKTPIFTLHSQRFTLCMETGAHMDWYPLYNSLRIAAISTAVVFFLGLLTAYYIARLPRLVKGALDVVLTLPLVLPPTVVGWLLLVLLGPNRPVGAWVLAHFGVRLVMTWWSAVFATVAVAFPLMYRTARGAFESFDQTLAEAGASPGPVQHLDLLAGADARVPPGHPGGDRAGLRPGPGGVRRHLHDRRLHAGADGHHLHHGLPALADRQRRRRPSGGCW